MTRVNINLKVLYLFMYYIQEHCMLGRRDNISVENNGTELSVKISTYNLKGIKELCEDAERVVVELNELEMVHCRLQYGYIKGDGKYVVCEDSSVLLSNSEVTGVIFYYSLSATYSHSDEVVLDRLNHLTWGKKLSGIYDRIFEELGSKLQYVGMRQASPSEIFFAMR